MTFPALSTVFSQLDPCIVVEDDTIILLDIEHTLRQLGMTDVRTATTLAKAEALATMPDVRFAVLDYELGHLANTLPLAETLASRSIPMIFLTAYGSNVALPASLMHVPVLSKPFTTEMLSAVLIAVAGAGEVETRQCLCG